jgi:hypothetical protein
MLLPTMLASCTKPVEVALHRFLHHREREAHDERGWQHDDGEQQEDQRRVGGVRSHDVAVDESGGQDPRADAEIDEPCAGQGQSRGDALHQEEEAARVGDAVDDPRADHQAGGVAQQEDGEHQREAVAVRLQQHADQPVPDDLQRHDQEAADEHQQRPSPHDPVRRFGALDSAGSTRVFHVEAARQQETAHRHDEVDQGAEIDRLVEAHRTDQVPAAKEGADAGAQRVEAVEPADELRGARDLADDRLGEERQRAAHQEGRPQQTREDDGEDHAARVRERQQLAIDHVVVEPRAEHGKDRNADLADREGDQGGAARQAIGIEAGGEAADAQTQQEGADDQRGGDRVGAGEQAEQPVPGGLVDEGGGSREEEQSEQRALPDTIRLQS